MKVVITGATGFLGRYLVQQCLSEGWQVVPIVREPGSFLQLNEVVCDFSKITKFELSSLIPEDTNAVVHLAAIPDFTYDLNKKSFEVNTIKSFQLAEVTAKKGAHFLFASAALIHGSKSKHIDENTPDNPDLPYMMSKWISERLIEDSVSQSTSVRISGIYGYDGPSHLFLNRALNAALTKKQIPTVDNKGSALRNYIYVKDAARWIIQLIEKKQTGRVYIAGSEKLSIAEMLNKASITWLKKKPLYKEGTEGYDQICVPSKPHPQQLTFEEALNDMKQEYEHDKNCGS